MLFRLVSTRVVTPLWVVILLSTGCLYSQPTSAAQCPADTQQSKVPAPGEVDKDSATATKGGADSPAMTLYMNDGQLLSWPVEVLVDHDIPDGACVELRLIQGHAVTGSLEGESMAIPAARVSPHQQWTGGAAEDGIDTQHHGTRLLFDLSGYPVYPWKAMTRVRPELSWTESGAHAKPVVILGKRLVNLGNAPVAWGWTLVMWLALLGSIVSLARLNGSWTPLKLLSGDDGHLSLSKCQMALWTLAIGAVVCFFALVRLSVPDIPASLVVLMGMSVLTTGISYHLGNQPDAAGTAAAVAPPSTATTDAPSTPPRFSDLLVMRGDASTPDSLSLTRAQMLFWTVLLVGIFVGKSILSGVLWDIPWALVALMGVSQTGYLAPKY